jgi:hypothetical protein
VFRDPTEAEQRRMAKWMRAGLWFSRHGHDGIARNIWRMSGLIWDRKLARR